MIRYTWPLATLALLATTSVASANYFDSVAHAQAMNDIAATPPWPDEGYEDDYYYDEPPSYSYDDWQSWADPVAIQEAQSNAALLADPRYQAFLDGEWVYTSGGTEYCSAVFLRGGVGAIIAALGGMNDPAIFLFFGMDIPAPGSTRTIRATLAQTGEAPATVEVFNTALPWNAGFGTIVFAVPTAADAIGGILDSQAFGVGIDGQTVAEIEWTGGNAARNALQQCLQAR